MPPPLIGSSVCPEEGLGVSPQRKVTSQQRCRHLPEGLRGLGSGDTGVFLPSPGQRGRKRVCPRTICSGRRLSGRAMLSFPWGQFQGPPLPETGGRPLHPSSPRQGRGKG